MQTEITTIVHGDSDQQTALMELIEAETLRGLPTEIEVGGEPTATQDFLARMAGCEDILPRTYCDDLELPRGSTHRDAAQALSALLQNR